MIAVFIFYGSNVFIVKSNDQGETWTQTWSTSTQNLPGMMVCVGPDGDTDGGSVYVVTNGGNTFSPTFNNTPRSGQQVCTFTLLRDHQNEGPW